jgi:DNA-directed RNA polymerase subunit M/transcription elongation factor TFIIS
MPRRALDPAGTCVACAESDMTCPHDHSLETLLQELLASGYVFHHDEIDARFARSRLVGCSNCGGAGCFDYHGVKRGADLRAFWSCRRCGHWIEV